MSIETVKKVISDIDTLVKSSKEEFANTIKDVSIPLTGRWELFVNAPSMFKETKSWIVNFDSLPEDAIMYDGDVYHAEKYQTVYTTDVVCSLKDILSKRTDYNSRVYDKLETHGVTVDQLKEEILSKNLESFTYDW